jgi:hypothetical protein
VVPEPLAWSLLAELPAPALLPEPPVLAVSLLAAPLEVAGGGFVATVTGALVSPPGAATVTDALYEATCAYVPHVSVKASAPALEADTV